MKKGLFAGLLCLLLCLTACTAGNRTSSAGGDRAEDLDQGSAPSETVPSVGENVEGDRGEEAQTPSSNEETASAAGDSGEADREEAQTRPSDGGSTSADKDSGADSGSGAAPSGEETAPPEQPEETNDMEENIFYVTVGGRTFSAAFADNSGAQAMRALLEEGPVTISMSDYGSFEKVGPLGQSLPTENVQTTTQAGDIVLYQGNQIVMFYGTNSWSYTRLGKVEDLTGWEEALGSGDVSVTFSLTAPGD